MDWVIEVIGAGVVYWCRRESHDFVCRCRPGKKIGIWDLKKEKIIIKVWVYLVYGVYQDIGSRDP